MGKSVDKIGNNNAFCDGNFSQVLLLSFSFMFIFTAFQTTGIIEETVLQSLRNESLSCQPILESTTHLLNKTLNNKLSSHSHTCGDGYEKSPTFTGNGYTSLSIIYAVFSIASWIAPSVVAITFPKWSMIVTSFIYVLFIASFLFPTTWLLYLLSVGLGASAAVLWTAQGNFLSIVSTPETVTRNSGVFWAINQCSLFFGNLLVFWQLQGKTSIDSQSRQAIFIPLTVVGVIGVCLLCILKNLRPDAKSSTDPDELQSSDPTTVVIQDHIKTVPKTPTETICLTALDALKEAIQLFITSHMLLLSLSSIYSGLEYSFLSGVYSTAVGNTKQLGVDAKKYVGLVGILTGVGEVLGGALFGLLGSRTTKKGRTPIVLLGTMVHVTSFVLIYYNIPHDATIKETDEVSLFDMPYPSIALICAFFLGFGDACLQTQLISTFASVYKEKSAAAFAIFKFTQSAASAAAFYSSTYMGVTAQMITLFVFCIISSTGFFLVEWRTGQLKLLEKTVVEVNEVEESSHDESELPSDSELTIGINSNRTNNTNLTSNTSNLSNHTSSDSLHI